MPKRIMGRYNKKYFKKHKSELLAYFIATLIIALCVYLPGVVQGIGWAFLYVAAIFGEGGMWYVISAIPLILFAILLTQVYRAIGLKDSFFLVSIAFSLNYIIASSLNAFFGDSIFFNTVSLGVVYGLFSIVSYFGKKIKQLQRVFPVFGLIILVGAAIGNFYIPSFIASPRYEMEDKNQLKNAMNAMNFTPYYPIYMSAEFSASSPELVNYSTYNDGFSSLYVSFQLGKAEVKESGFFTNQDKVMNFKNNCNISTISFAIGNDTTIRDDDITTSLDNFQKCKFVTTPAGKKVYINDDDGQWTYLYAQMDKTNIVIEFDDINTEAYEEKKLPELLKLIDSLQPLDRSKLQPYEY